MIEFIGRTLFGFTEKAENRVSKIVSKLFYYFNCVVISIWTSEKIGFGFTYEAISYDSVARFVFSLSILIPFLIFLFVYVISRYSIRVFAIIMENIFPKLLNKLFYNNIKPDRFLVAEEVVTSDSKKGLHFDLYFKHVEKTRKQLTNINFWIEYICDFWMTLIFIYTVIVRVEFSALFYTLINVGLFMITIGFLINYVKVLHGLEINRRMLEIMENAE